MSSDRILGRDDELRSTLAALCDLRHGEPSVVIVGGPAGIGKTRFVTAVADGLRADGVRVMTGACLDLGAGAPPYAALISAFRSVDPPAVQLLDALTGAMAMRRSRLFDLLRGTLAALAQRRPTVLVIEDVHWSDRITRDALLYLVGLTHVGQWALVVTFRDDEVAARPVMREFLDVLRRDAVVSVTLEALSASEVAAQIVAIAGYEPSADDAERVHRRSGGVPLLVEEVLAAEAAGFTGVPDHLRDLFVARVRSLGPEVLAAVEAVAVIGDGWGERVVAGMLAAERPDVAAALDRAAAADVVVTDGKSYRMRHELLRDAIFDSLSPGRRRRLHARAASVLGAMPQSDSAVLAHHWYAADEPAEAALANLDAARLAERVHAPGEVHRYLERALEHFDALAPERSVAEGGRGALLARAAEAAYLNGEFEQAVPLAEQALTESDRSAVEALRWERLARYCWVSRDGAGAQRAHEQSIAVLRDDDAPADVRARVLSGYGWYLGMAGRRDEARTWSQHALAAADASDDPLERCRALLAWGYARVDEESGLDALRTARALAVACDAGEELARAHGTVALSLQRLGHTTDREQVLRDGMGYVAAHGLARSYEPVIKYLLADFLFEVGRWDEAGELLEQVVARGVVGVPAMFTHAYRARLAAARGHTATTIECADRVVVLSGDLPQQPLPHSIAVAALAESCAWAGELDNALAYASKAESLASDRVVRAEATVMLARACADLAEHARRRGEPVALPTVIPPAAGSHPRLQAVAATVYAEHSRQDGHRDPAPWRKAVVAWDSANDPYRAAYGRWRQAHALLATRPGRQEAALELNHAQRAASDLAARPLLDAVESLAAASRIHLAARSAAVGDPGPASVAARLGVTPRELEILPYLVAGRTNIEIAELLVISPRTVGVHVSRILHKLGATRRTEAADIARRRGLVAG